MRPSDEAFSLGEGTRCAVRRDHDHDRCIDSALHAAQRVCAAAGARLTPLRRRVLLEVWKSHAPVGAYDILRSLERDAAKVAPPTVYRALDFLMEYGLVHRLESQNAFIGCRAPERAHAGHFLICARCDVVVEFDNAPLNAAIEVAAARCGFTARRAAVEVLGLCPSCRGDDAPLSSAS